MDNDANLKFSPTVARNFGLGMAHQAKVESGPEAVPDSTLEVVHRDGHEPLSHNQGNGHYAGSHYVDGLHVDGLQTDDQYGNGKYGNGQYANSQYANGQYGNGQYARDYGYGYGNGNGYSNGYSNDHASGEYAHSQFPLGQTAKEQNSTPSEQYPEAIKHINRRRKRICGLPVLWFWVAIAAIALIIGVGLGAGLGVGLGSSSKDESAASTTASSTSLGGSGTASATASRPPPAAQSSGTSSASSESSTAASATSSSSESPSSTRSAPASSGTTGIAAISCTFTGPRTYDAADGDATFMQYCKTDWPVGKKVAGGGSSGTAVVVDLQQVLAYTFEDCMEACVSHNRGRVSGKRCGAVTYNANLTEQIALKKKDGNCFLKDSRGEQDFKKRETVASAVLLDDE